MTGEVPHWVLFILLAVLISSEIVNWYNNAKVNTKLKKFEVAFNNTISSKFKVLLGGIDKLLTDNEEVKRLIELKLGELEKLITELPNNMEIIDRVVELELTLNADIQTLMKNSETVAEELKKLNGSESNTPM